MERIPIKIKLLEPDAKIPFYATPGAAAFDIYGIEEVVLHPGQTYAVRTGIAMEIPQEFYVKFEGRSGLGLKGIAKFAGVIDSDYRGEVKVILCNTGKEPFKIEKGDRIGQGIVMSKYTASFIKTDSLSKTERGAGGFASTGMK